MVPTIYAFEILFESNNPSDSGTVPVLYDGDGIPSTSTRWKSSRLLASSSGTATHFIIRVGSNGIGTQPVGFAVYASTGPDFDDPPANTPLIRGYIPSYDFNVNGAGYYAFPFNDDATLAVNSGTWYHVVYLLTPGSESLSSGWRVGDGPPPAKWGSRCHGIGCDPDMPPGVGSEDSFLDAGVWYGCRL